MARQAKVREAALTRLFESRKPLTAKEMGCSPVVAGRLRDFGFTVKAGERKAPANADERRGRPQFVYRLSAETRREVGKARRNAQRRKSSAKVTA